MDSLHYGVVRIADRWKLLGKGLKYGDFDDREMALRAAEGLADYARGLGLDVKMHAQDADGTLHHQDAR